MEGSEVQAQAGDPSVLSGSICGGGLEFSGVLFPFQLRLSLNRKGSCKPPPPPPRPTLHRGKDQFQVSQNHIRSFVFSFVLRNQDSGSSESRA